MPINIPDNLPATKALRDEHIFVMSESQALHQDIRPLKILILNIMPEKPKTELHLLRRLSNTPIQIEIDLIHPATHECKTTPKEHLETFYKTFNDVKDNKYDGFIITGAPVEHLEFEDVDYWDELKEIMEWSKSNVTSTLHICWAAQAGLYYHYGIHKEPIPEKMFGIFKHKISVRDCPLLNGFDDVFWAPHSRHTALRRSDIDSATDVTVISESDEAGLYILKSKDNRQIFITGHSEYDPLTLKQEYDRDKAKGLAIDVPKNYFPDDSPDNAPVVTWKSHSCLLFQNWINYYVYQMTPFEIETIK